MTASDIRKIADSLAIADPVLDCARLYSIGSVDVTVVAEPKALEWCDHYLVPSMTSAPLNASSTNGSIVRAIRGRSQWQDLQLALAEVDSTNSQTYNGTPILEWNLGEGLYVQQYVARKSFTVVDATRHVLTFVDDGESDPGWWMEPSRAVREIATRQLEELGTFVFHAATVAIGGSSAAIIGPKRAGKTTLTVAALEYAKAAYISNDRTYIDVESGRFHVSGWPVTAAFGIGTCLASPTLRSLVESGIKSRYPQPALESRLDLDEFRRQDALAMMQERVKIELTPLEIGEVFGVPVVPRQTLDALIFPRLDPTCGQPEAAPVAPSEAAWLLREQILTCDDAEYPDWLHLRRLPDAEIHLRAMAFADQLVSKVPAYSLRYWDAATAAGALGNVLAAREAVQQ